MGLEKIKSLLAKPQYLFLLLSISYFATRLINLEILPIFNDESTYIRYGIHQINEPLFKPYSLLIGKEPLLPQLFAAFGQAFGDLLLAARIISVFFGFLTLSGLFIFSYKILNTKAALIIGVLYTLCPFTLFFDRLALLDSAINSVAIWSLFLTYLIIQRPKWWMGIALGFVIGIGLYIKTTAIFYFFLPYFCLAQIFVNKQKPFSRKLLSLKIIILSSATGLIIFFPLFSNEYYKIHLELLNQYTYPLSSIFSIPIKVWINNFSSALTWLIFYLTPAVFLLGFFGMIKNLNKQKINFVYFWFFIPLVYEILYAKLFSGRHVLLLSIPLIIFAGYALSTLNKNKIISYLVIIAIVLPCLFYNIIIWSNPIKLPDFFLGAAKKDINQYVHGFSSGYGVLPAIKYLERLAEKEPIRVITRADHGNPEDAVVAYLAYKRNISILLITKSEDLSQLDLEKPTFFVSRGAYYLGLERFLKDEVKFEKPEDSEFIGVYRLDIN